MTPAFAANRIGSANTPRRMAFVYVPNGIIMKDWTPAAEGSAFDFSRILKPLEPHRRDLMVLSGLTQNTGRALGDGPGDHARAAASFLTGIHPKKTAGADISSEFRLTRSLPRRLAAPRALHRSSWAVRMAGSSAIAIPVIAALIAIAFRGAPVPRRFRRR